MKLSKYNLCYPKNDQYIVFNTFTNSLVILSSEEYHDLQILTTLSPENINIYKQLGLIIDDNVDELAMMRFDNAFFSANAEPHFRILTTTACNAKCIYCYEEGIPIKTMDNKTANKVVEFIRKTATSDQTIHIEWFGGEPLVNIQPIISICTELNSLGYAYESTMVTNGILLTNNNIEKLKSICRLTKIQITLDGLADVYSSVKKVSPDSFYTVLKNIELLANNEITVQVRMNYVDNHIDLASLIQYLGNTLGFNKRIFYYIYPVFEKQQSVPRDVMEHVLSLNDLLVTTGLMKKGDLYQFKYRQTRCFASNYNSYTIAPDGSLYNCTHVMHEEGYVGTLENYSPYNPNRIRFVEQTVSKQCSECKLYPFCKGGCRAAELGEAELHQCVIYKSCIEAVLERLLDMGIE